MKNLFTLNQIFKNFILLFTALTFILMTSNSFAQTFGLKAGLNLSNLFVDDGDETYSFDMNPGFQVGPIVEISLNDNFAFETGLLLSTKGFKESESDTYGGVSYEYNRKMILYYLDIPLTLKPSVDLGKVKLYGNIGPYIGVGVSGKYKDESIIGDEVEKDKEDIKFGSDEDFKRLDYGIMVGAGIGIKFMEFGLSYGYGLANIPTDADDDEKANNRVLSISVAYKFGGK